METQFDARQYVQQLDDGRWIVAAYDEQHNQWYCPMTAEEQRVTGCHTYIAHRLEDLGGSTFSAKSSAMRRARQAYDYKEA